jgi:hypothetical protein
MQVCDFVSLCLAGGGRGRETYDGQRPDEHVRRRLVRCYHLSDEIRSHANYGDEAYGLHSSGDGERCSESSECWCWHVDGWWG